LLAQYGLGELVYYGWFSVIARPLVQLLHLFHVVLPYGLAIILLTVVVRGAMFPLSRKQALGAIKMQQIQPELKRIQEQYKNNAEAKMKAQQELFRKHNYHPASGCLVMLIQLPIFVALYRGLMVDVELRQAPLISESIRWCSNLAAPDMFFDWSGFMPAWINNGQGIFGLGPYFNLLPILTIVLFIAQQKMFMPPPADDQAAMQQKIMKYMMIFIGVLFFKVASGLCIYFIASSLWGLGERQFMPKPAKDTAAGPAAKTTTRADAKARERAEAEAAAKARAKAKARESADGDGAAARHKRRKARRGKR
jgi:YidC/Oxa1 family membrane protein insertase